MFVAIERKSRSGRPAVPHSPQHCQAAHLIGAITGINERSSARLSILSEELKGFQCPLSPSTPFLPCYPHFLQPPSPVSISPERPQGPLPPPPPFPPSLSLSYSNMLTPLLPIPPQPQWLPCPLFRLFSNSPAPPSAVPRRGLPPQGRHRRRHSRCRKVENREGKDEARRRGGGGRIFGRRRGGEWRDGGQDQ